jgi:metal-responsive CopG/Arc/MetJ family transcriptional regulator
MFVGMRVKTSVTIDEAVLRAIDKVTGHGRSRPRIIEDAARAYLAARARAARDARDLQIVNAAADSLNREMEDVLRYQGDV